MGQVYNVYCDESCHLEKDQAKSMVLGGVWCPQEEVKEFNQRIREIKAAHGLKKDFEIKWTKISPAKLDFYLNVVDYFFDNDDLHFRCLVIPDKTKIDHEKYQQTHNDWYYKMFFCMLKTILNPGSEYYIYLDIKDTNGAVKISKLREVLCNSILDFDRKVVKRIQNIRSHEVGAVQVADLLIGAMGHFHRGLKSSEAKNKVIERIKARSGYSLEKSTLEREDRFNIFVWDAS